MFKGNTEGQSLSRVLFSKETHSEKDMVLFGVALSELLETPIHAYLKTVQTPKGLKFKVVYVYCYLSEHEILGIDGVTQVSDNLTEYEGYLRLSTNNPITFLELIDEEESTTRPTIRNYQIAILDTYSEKLNKKTKETKHDPVTVRDTSRFR